MTDKFDRTHGSTGTQPPDGKEFQQDERPDESYFDWFWYNVHTKINSLIDDIAGKADDPHGNESHTEDYVTSSETSTYTDSDAIDAINTDSDHGSTASHNYSSIQSSSDVDHQQTTNRTHSGDDLDPNSVNVSSNLALPTASEGDTAPSEGSLAIDSSTGELLIGRN